MALARVDFPTPAVHWTSRVEFRIAPRLDDVSNPLTNRDRPRDSRVHGFVAGNL